MISAPDPLASWLAERLPPTAAGFAEIAQAYLASADRPRFLRALKAAEVETPTDIGGSSVPMMRDFGKLAETLLLFEGALAPAGDRAAAMRRAYRHYVVNTDGPIPVRAGEAEFDPFAWLEDYAAGFGIRLQPVSGPDGERQTLMTIDDPARPVRCAAWGIDPRRSSAWTLREAGQVLNFRRYGRRDVVPSQLFAFDAKARAHRMANALWLADLSQLVYMKAAYVRAHLGRLGYGLVRWLEDAHSDTQAVLAAGGEHALLVFRGTEGATDIFTDLNFAKMPFVAGPPGGPPVGDVHRGFLKALDSVWPQVHAALQAVYGHQPVFVAGHSLGAALAQLAAMRIAAHGHEVAGVYTYGSPRVGTPAFRDAYDAALGERTFMHVNDEDLVTRVPPAWTGFAHVAQPARRFDRGHRLSRGGPDESTLAPPKAEADERKRAAVEAAADAFRQSQSYLGVDDVTRGVPGLSYAAAFEQGGLDNHGVAQYLFKFACALIEQRMEAMGVAPRGAGAELR